jgi:site-specific recombinase XerD
MATIKFYTRSKVNKIVPVYVRFVFSRQAVFIVKTGISIQPEYFNNNTGAIKQRAVFANKSDIDKKLRDLHSFLLDKVTLLTDPPTKLWITETIDSFHNPGRDKPDNSLVSFIQGFIDKAPARGTPKTGRPVCYKQIREYERTFHYLKEFASEKKRKLEFEEINLNFYYDFIEYLQSEKTAITKKGKEITVPGLAQNTIGKKIQTLKIFLNAATEQNINGNLQYRSHRFTAMSEESQNIYLNETDLNNIAGLNLINNPSLERIRDLFLIGCWTGLRFSDWNKVNKANISDGFLELKQQKTNQPVVIPLHPAVTTIIDKYNGQLPRIISNQKFNDALKIIAQQAKLTEIVYKSITKGGIQRSTRHFKYEQVTTHTARRSFATNLYKQGFPTLSIMQITGHRTEVSFLKYIKVTPREHAEKLRTFWQDQIKLKAV